MSDLPCRFGLWPDIYVNRTKRSHWRDPNNLHGLLSTTTTDEVRSNPRSRFHLALYPWPAYDGPRSESVNAPCRHAALCQCQSHRPRLNGVFYPPADYSPLYIPCSCILTSMATSLKVTAFRTLERWWKCGETGMRT